MLAASTRFYASGTTVFQVECLEPGRFHAVPEAVVQALWAQRHYEAARLRTTDGRRVEVLHPGQPNHAAGPDFVGSTLRIDGALVSGDVEVHVRSSQWEAHGHGTDAAYGRVVLHVVLHTDAATGTLRRADGTRLPEIELAPVLDGPLRSRLHTFFAAPPDVLPCRWGHARVPTETWNALLLGLARRRVLRRASEIARAPDPLQARYERTARALGGGGLSDALESVARTVPLAVLHTAPDAPARTALLLQAFDGTSDATFRPTRRLRPAGQPARRLAQLSALAAPDGLLALPPAAFAEALAAASPAHALDALLDPAAGVGRERRQGLLINALLPAAVAAAGCTPDALDRALAVLRALPPERDHVQSYYEAPPLPTSALHTQGWHELYRTACTPRACLSCRVGKTLLSG